MQNLFKKSVTIPITGAYELKVSDIDYIISKFKKVGKNI